MIPYTLHVALLISVCLCFYKLLLTKETFYRLNRFVLISILALSFLIPLVPVPQQWAFGREQQVVTNNAPVIKNNLPYIQQPQAEVEKNIQQNNSVQSSETITSSVFSWSQIMSLAFFLYWIGVLIFAANFLLQLVVLLYSAWTKPVIKDGRFKIIELDGDKAPCSFANYIFINPAKYEWDTYNQILLHEKTHIQQRHTIDIVLAELLVIVQWFNPFAWLYRKELENNLEYLTDNSMLEQHKVERESYQLSLLKVSVPHFSLGLTTNYNQSTLQKRIVMMNAKKSNLNTMWKYLFILPLIAGLMCALNDTIAYGQTKENNTKGTTHNNNAIHDRSSGAWFATIKGDKVRMQFTSDDSESWNSNSDFMLSEFSALPKNGEGEFTLTREAGTMLFKGKFDGDKGYGDYKFTPSAEYSTYLKSQGITGIQDDDAFAFFIINIKKDYVKMLQENGYKNLPKDDLISMAALKVDAAFINMWKQNGFKDLAPDDLVSTKAMGLDNDYVSDIKKAGYKDLTIDQLISFKAQNITGDYINSLRNSKSGISKDDVPNADEITSYKAMNITEDFIKSFEAIGIKDLPSNELTALKATNTTPEFIKSFMDIGYKDISVETAISLKSLNVTPEFIKGFQSMGFNDLSLDDMISAKATGVNADFIKGFESLGITSTKFDNYVPLKSLGITPDYVNGFKKLGFNNISLDDLPALKSTGVTPDFINGFKKLGFNNISLDDLPALKSTGVTPEFVKSMQDKGIKLNSLDKYIQLKTSME